MNKESQSTVKKIGLAGCIATGVGAIIGSGIFGSLPEVINSVGAGAIGALVVAVIYIIATLIPSMFASSVIPATGSFFLYQAKLVHPIAGLFMAIQNLLFPVLVSVFAVLFADYFTALIPALVNFFIVGGPPMRRSDLHGSTDYAVGDHAAHLRKDRVDAHRNRSCRRSDLLHSANQIFEEKRTGFDD